ncbi:hypothetical protein ES703_40363 [subsurface metagenome]
MGVKGSILRVPQLEMQVGAGDSAGIPGISDNVSPPHRNVGAPEPQVQGIFPLAFLEDMNPSFQARSELLQMRIYGQPTVFQTQIDGLPVAPGADQQPLHVAVFHGIDLVAAGAAGGDVQSGVVPAGPHIAEGGGNLAAGFGGPVVILCQAGACEQKQS